MEASDMALTVLGAAGALAGLAGTAYGMINSGNVGAAQNQLAYRNMTLQQRLAARQQAMAEAGSRDALGNVIEYIDGVGWVERPTPETQALMLAQQNEQRQQLTNDAIRQRLASQQAFSRGQQAHGAATAELATLQNGSQTRDGLLGRSIEAGVADSISGSSALRSQLGRQQLRGGMTTAGRGAIEQASATAQPNTRTAIAKARLDTPQLFNDLDSQRRSQLTQRVAGLSQMASQGGGSPINASAYDSGLSASARANRFSGIQGLSGIRLGQSPQYIDDPGKNAGMNIAALGQALTGFTENDYIRGLLGAGSRSNGGKKS
jgi:hypothetical protein